MWQNRSYLSLSSQLLPNTDHSPINGVQIVSNGLVSPRDFATQRRQFVNCHHCSDVYTTNNSLLTSLHFANAFVTTSSSHLTALSSASWRSINPWSVNFVRGHYSTMWIIVCRSPRWHLSEEVRHHFCRLAAHNPVFVRKRSSNDHVWRGNSKPGCQTVGSDTSLVGHDCRIPNFLPPRFYIRSGQDQPVVFWNKAGLVGGQTHRCGLASLSGALSSLSMLSVSQGGCISILWISLEKRLLVAVLACCLLLSSMAYLRTT